MHSGKPILVVVASLVLAGCLESESNVGRVTLSNEGATPYTYRKPPARADGWLTALVTDVGIDEAGIVALAEKIRKDAGPLDSILIARDGQLVFELYQHGYDWYTLHEMRSVSKSVMSLLTGIAIDKGVIPDVNSTVLPLFPEYSPYNPWDDRKNDITVRNLLMMASGLDCDDNDGESAGSESLMFLSNDWVQFFLELPMVRNPGAEFHYCAGSVLTLAGVIEKYSGTSSAEFARMHLFDVLNIQQYDWLESPDGRLHPNGLFIGSRDLLKIGQVMLDGTWQGVPVVSAEWIAESTAHQINDEAGDSAGYLWWRTPLEIDGVPEDAFFAYGALGQSVLVVPSRNLVVGFTATNYGPNAFRYEANLVVEYILPALLTP